MSYTVAVGLYWEDEDAAHIQSRSMRYAGALDIERLVEVSPYPTSRVGATGFIGYSPSAGKVLVVIAYRDLDGDLHGMNAWPASGRDLATYLKEGDDGEGS